jgi:glycerophosphoryl diester phosphodiesterase
LAAAPSFAGHGHESRPVVIGHRGASGYIPEHTLAAYAIAIEQGADFIEPDLVSTKDGVLVARHENEIGGTTDVSARPEFASRRTTKSIDGTDVTGWFTEDFTLRELKTLRAKERIPAIRPENTRFDGMFQIPTLDEVIMLAKGASERRALAARQQRRPKPAPIGIYPETKHPTYFDSIGLSLEEPLVRTLRRHGLVGRNAPVIIQSFEVSNLKDLRRMTRVPIAQLINSGGKPFDFVVSGDPRTYSDLITPAGLREIATYATGIGAEKSRIIPRDADGRLTTPTTLVDDAHRAGLIVHGWTFRAENTFLPLDYRSSTVPEERGDLEAEVKRYLATGMDGFFTDQPDIGVRARDAFVAGR